MGIALRPRLADDSDNVDIAGGRDEAPPELRRIVLGRRVENDGSDPFSTDLHTQPPHSTPSTPVVGDPLQQFGKRRVDKK